METPTAITAAKSLLDLTKEIGSLLARAAEAPNVVHRARIYLEAARASVSAMGSERQQILSDVRRCDLSNPADVTALWVRLDRYLHEDNIRPHLKSAVEKPGACRREIETKSDAAWWRARDKQAAALSFSETFFELQDVLNQLTWDFYPGGSGMGIQTLLPIYDRIKSVHEEHKAGNARLTYEAETEALAVLMRKALRDDSHGAWFRTAASVDALIAELELAFSIKVATAPLLPPVPA